MRLLQTDCQGLRLKTYQDESKLPPYAILSHTWLADTEEITYSDLQLSTDRLQAKEGWRKLNFALSQAARDGLNFLWVDTCCIDKSSSAELAEAINSMYRFYRNASICYVYLQDLPDPSYETDGAIEVLSNDSPVTLTTTSAARSSERAEVSRDWNWNVFARCRWFTRGWTLQEMIASPTVHFYNGSSLFVGALDALAPQIATITGVDKALLEGCRQTRSFSIAQRMSWAANRTTTRIEDRAYSLLGLFDISMAIIYGEGERAFQRLQEELLKVYSDHTLFAWTHQEKVDWTGILAHSPDDFRNSAKIVPIKRERPEREYEVTSREIKFDLPVYDLPEKVESRDNYAAVLSCRVEDEPTKIVLLELMRIPSGGFVRKATPELVVGDIYDASLRTTVYPVSVLRYTDDTRDRGAESKMNLLMCRYRHEGSQYPDVYISAVSGALVTTVRHRDWDLDYTTREAVGDWKPDIGCFVLPDNLERPIYGSPAVEIPWKSLSFTIECDISLSSGSGPLAVARLSISPNIADWTWKVSNNDISFRPRSRAARRGIISRISSELSSGPIASLGDSRYITGRAARTKLLHESFWLCEIEIRTRRHLIKSLLALIKSLIFDAIKEVPALFGISLRYPWLVPILLLMLISPMIPLLLIPAGLNGYLFAIVVIVGLSIAGVSFVLLA